MTDRDSTPNSESESTKATPASADPPPSRPREPAPMARAAVSAPTPTQSETGEDRREVDDAPAAPEDVAPDPELVATATRRPYALAGVAAVVAILGVTLCFYGMPKLGLWDPHELVLADHGCRRAAQMGKLPIDACGIDQSTIAKTTDLRSWLMIESVAWGFRLLGLSEASGRLPLALWILAGAIALVVGIGRLVDARAGLYAGIAFLTMPMVLVQSRLILGDAVTMGTFAMAFAGLAVAVFDREHDDQPLAWSRRLPWLLLGLFGTVAGIGARGVAVATAPAAAVAAGWLCRILTAPPSGTSRRRGEGALSLATVVIVVLAAVAAHRVVGQLHRDFGTLPPALPIWLAIVTVVGGALFALLPDESSTRSERGVAGALLGLGVAGVSMGVLTAWSDSTTGFVALVGAPVNAPRKFPTFDLFVRQIAHGAFPWACFLPFALGKILAKPARSQSSPATTDAEVGVRVTTLLAITMVFAVQTFAAPRFGVVAFAGPAALAVACAIALRDLERAPAGSLAVAIGTTILAGLVINDFLFEDLAKTPVELATAPLLEPYAVYGVGAPDELRTKLKLVLVAIAAIFLLPMFFVWVDEDPRPGWTKLRVLLWPIDALRKAWKHPWYNPLLLLLASFEVCLVVVGVVTYKAALRRSVATLQALSGAQRDLVVNLWWYLLAAVVLIYVGYVGFLLTRDAFRALKRQRVLTIAMGGLAAGAVWSFWIMPAVANQFSPRNVFATYRSIAQRAPIALLGLSPRTAAYDLGGTKPISLNDARSAHRWLSESSERRFLALRSEHLAELNSLWRKQASPRTNLPILDGRSAQIVLASNDLGGRSSQNPLDRLVLDDVPTATTGCSATNSVICAPTHKLECNIDNKLACVGWDLLDPDDRPLSVVTSGQRVKLRQIFRVIAPVSGTWQVFVHVEQPGTATARRTPDHAPLGGKYPMEQWLAGDIVVDDHEFNLEPNMTPGRPISLMAGLFTGSSRMPLISGPDAGPESEGMRLVLGSVAVQ